MVSAPDPPRFKLIGGAVCLDLLNTVDGTRAGHWVELLADYGSLVAFAEQSEVLDTDEAEGLRRAASTDGPAAQRVLRRAHQFREALYRVLTATGEAARPDADDVERLNREVAKAMTHARLCATGACWEWGWDPDTTSLERVLWPIVHDAADLMTSPDLERVRECGSDACTWMFLDTTKNRRRRWCQMEVCGNRAKARRHRARSKKES